MKTQLISLNDFMSGAYKEKPEKKKYGILKKVATSTIIPFALLTPKAFASAPDAVTVAGSVAGVVGAKAGEAVVHTGLGALSHALDPLINLMLALSLPIASVIMVGACFFFMFDNSEKAWSMIMKAGLGYILIQLSPLFIQILKGVGSAII